MPESQGLNAKFDCYYVFILVVNNVYNNSRCKSNVFFGKDEEKLVNCWLFVSDLLLNEKEEEIMVND